MGFCAQNLESSGIVLPPNKKYIIQTKTGKIFLIEKKRRNKKNPAFLRGFGMKEMGDSILCKMFKLFFEITGFFKKEIWCSLKSYSGLTMTLVVKAVISLNLPWLVKTGLIYFFFSCFFSSFFCMALSPPVYEFC